MKFKSIYGFATICFASTILVACNSSSTSNTLQKIEDKGKIVVALNPEFPHTLSVSQKDVLHGQPGHPCAYRAWMYIFLRSAPDCAGG